MGTAAATPARPRARPKLDAHGVLLVSTSCSDRNAALERGRHLLFSYARTFFDRAAALRAVAFFATSLASSADSAHSSLKRPRIDRNTGSRNCRITAGARAGGCKC